MKTLPYQRNGATYCTGPNGQPLCTGSMMGRRDTRPRDLNAPGKLRLLKVRMTADQCYDVGGAYWGQGTEPLYVAFGDVGEDYTELWLRATDREHAKDRIRVLLPSVTFNR